MRFRVARSVVTIAAVALCAATARPASADFIFFTNDQVGFLAAQTSSGNTPLGTETFDQSTATPGNVTVFNDPLTQGVPNGPFPTGLMQPFTIQSNTLAGGATSPSPQGFQGLVNFAEGGGGNTSDVVLANDTPDSLDFIFNRVTNIAGVGFNTISIFDASLLQIQVFDLDDVLRGTTMINGNPQGTNFIGIQATGDDRIGRINIFSTTFGDSQQEGGDNIQLFQANVAAVPEPSTWAMMIIGVIGLVIAAQRRKTTERVWA